MLKIIKKITITIFLVIPVIGGVSFAKDDKIVATYMMNGKKTIRESEMISYYHQKVNQSQGSFSDLSAEEKQALIEEYLVAKLLDQEAEKKNILKSEKLKERIKISEKEFLRDEFLNQKINITDEMVNDQYQKIVNMTQGKEEVKIAHILVDNKDQAVQIKRKLSKGAKFSDLAKEFSKDKNTKDRGGELSNYIDPRNIQPKEYRDKVFSMKKNEISDPIEINNEWYIIKVLDKRAIIVPPKEQIKEKIRLNLFVDAINKYAEDLLEKVNFEIKI